MRAFNEETLETRVGPWTQRVVGVLLLLFTALGVWYAVTTLWPGQKPSSTDPRWLSIAVLAATPFLITLALQLIIGNLRDAQVFPPAALIVIGLVLVVGSIPFYISATKLGISAAREALGFFFLGGWAIWIGWQKLGTKTPLR